MYLKQDVRIILNIELRGNDKSKQTSLGRKRMKIRYCRIIKYFSNKIKGPGPGGPPPLNPPLTKTCNSLLHCN